MENYIENIKSKTSKMGVDYDMLPQFLQNYLLDIEKEICLESCQMEGHIAAIRNQNLNVSAIAKRLGISRTTFYSYDSLLSKYVELSAKEIEAENPYAIIIRQKEKIVSLSDMVSKMQDRDVQILVLQHKVEELESQLAKNVHGSTVSKPTLVSLPTSSK